MRLGTCVASITPQVPITMGGYAARTEKARGVHDDLTARALVLEDRRVRTGLVVADLLMFSRSQVEAVQARAAALTGIPANQIVVAATHTHSGPSAYAYPHAGDDVDPTYAAWVVEVLAGALYQAWQDLDDVRVGWSAGGVAGVASSRRAAHDAAGQAPDSEFQPLAALSFTDLAGDLRAVLVNFQAHPTVLGADNLLISADLAGAAREALQGLFGPDVFIAFVNGACGDVSTRFTRRSQTFQELRRLGGLLGAAAAGVILESQWDALSPGDLKVATKQVELPVRALPSPEEAQAQLVVMKRRWEEARANPKLSRGELRVARTALEGAQVQAFLADSQNTFERQAVLTGWRLGGAGLVTIPGELFSSLGARIRMECGLETTLVVGYSGGHVGYVPDRRAYEQGGYEALSSLVAPEAGETLAAAAVDLLKSLA